VFSFRIGGKITAPGFQMSQLPPDRESLQALLGRVHERLNESGSVDSGSRELLAQLMGDIERALAQPGGDVGKPVSARPTAEGVAEGKHTPRLESLAVKFEAEHPALAESLYRLADLLGKAGI
jgi:hypothetical protein